VRRLQSSRRRPAALLALLVGLALGLSACGGAPGAHVDAAAHPQAPDDPLPLATSLQAAGGTWAVVPMGRLDQPINTFWQLLDLPAGATSWSDRVEATATATNGGLLLAGAGRFLAVGILPSTLLRFTPLIATDDAGRSWSDGLVGTGVDAHAAALAVESPDAGLALTAGSPGGEVLSAAGSLSRWGPLLSRATLARTAAGVACDPGALTTVGYLAGRPALGASCATPGVLGLFVETAGRWARVPASLPSSLRSDRLEVLWYGGPASRPEAVVEASGPPGSEVVVLWAAGAARWTVSAPLALGPGASVGSASPLPGGGVGLLVTDGQARARFETVRPGGAWLAGPDAPAGTETVAAVGGGGLEALAGAGDTLAVWSLDRSGGDWRLRQSMHVPISYGSSSS